MSDQHVPHVLGDKAERMESSEKRGAGAGITQQQHWIQSPEEEEEEEHNEAGSAGGGSRTRAEGSGWGRTGDGLKYGKWSWIMDSGLLAMLQAIWSTISHCLLSTICCKWLLFKEPPF